MHAFGALGLIQYWMRRVNFSCRAISLIFFSPQNMHASVISITPKYIEILFNFNQYYRSTWKAFAFCFIIPERYINFPFLWRMGVTTPADPHWNGRWYPFFLSSSSNYWNIPRHKFTPLIFMRSLSLKYWSIYSSFWKKTFSSRKQLIALCWIGPGKHRLNLSKEPWSILVLFTREEYKP